MITIMKAVVSKLFKGKKQEPVSRGFKAEKPEVDDQGQEVYRNIYGRPVADAELQFYPPKIEGLDVVAEEAILQRYKKEIELLFETTRLESNNESKNDLQLPQEMFISVIRNLASYVHLLPASECHHHSQPGGLFRHSLEAGLLALKYAEKKSTPSIGATGLDRERRSRYIFSAWLGGILHDIGKVITDVEVKPLMVLDGKKSVPIHNAPRKIASWSPRRESLTEWAKKNHVVRYCLHFNEGRFKEHESQGFMLLPDILKDQALDFVLEFSDELYDALYDSLSGYKHHINILKEAIQHGDSISVKNDSRPIEHPRFGMWNGPKKSCLINLMRLLRKEWVCNEPDAPLWIVGDEVYLEWKKAFQSIIKRSKEVRIDTVAQNITALYQEMNDLLITESFDEQNSFIYFCEGNFEYEDALSILNGDCVVQWVTLIKIRYKNSVFAYDPLPPSARGIIFLESTGEFILTYENGTQKRLDINRTLTAASKNDKASSHENSTEEMVLVDSVPSAENQYVKTQEDIKTVKVLSKNQKKQSVTNSDSETRTANSPEDGKLHQSNSMQSRSIQLEQVLKTSSSGTLGWHLRTELSDKNPADYIQIVEDRAEFDLLDILRIQNNSAGSHAKYMLIQNAVLEFLGPESFDPLCTEFRVPVEALKVVKITD